MTYAPHLRLTMSGTVGAGEIFSCTLNLEPNAGIIGQTAANWLASQIPDEIMDDIVDDCEAFWSRPATMIHALAVLTRVKLAHIGSDGRYSSAPIERAVSVPGGTTSAANECPAWQVSRKVTLETDGDLGRIKGGFYLPLPPFANTVWDPTIGLFTADCTEGVRGSVVTLLNDLANEPGLDALDLKPVVASQGRHNANGTVRVGPDNHVVQRVSVGRRPDVQRRRGNARTESRVASVATSL